MLLETIHLPASTIETIGLGKTYGNRQALCGIDLAIKSGERVVLFGPNGAGKTTLIKILANITRPSSGRVLVEGTDFKTGSRALRRKIGLVSHATFLYGHLSIYENLDFYARLYDIRNRDTRIREIVDKVEMSLRLHDRVDRLSRGMQQRISIARALLHQPAILLLDEPETGLDQRSLSIIWPILLDNRRTVVFATHSLERGFDLCDRMIILVKGKIVHDCLKTDTDFRCLKENYDSLTGVGV
jgi:heme exporter protein A